MSTVSLTPRTWTRCWSTPGWVAVGRLLPPQKKEKWAVPEVLLSVSHHRPKPAAGRMIVDRFHPVDWMKMINMLFTIAMIYCSSCSTVVVSLLLSDLSSLRCPILCSDWSTLSLTSCPAVPAPEDLPLAFALVLALLLVGAAACAAAGGRSSLPAAFLAGSLHPAATTAAAPHSGSSCGLRDRDRDPVAEVSLFFFLFVPL